ncbi:hypothetical protein PILCRDRAFT_817998 [Piloderma croceum F 1598]|uniref:DUF4189 domain-containing protein n=1 Tax=Piloderma croceum (strain F 1598) TaxID=765440 RepID=A0A0C3FJ42_PILCF|nr:hypothetical protein PILCRDRAFT_817998 [Piloderma croceum F 1598]
MSVVVVSNIFGVFGTPFAAQSEPSSTNLSLNGVATTLPTGSATPSPNVTFSLDSSTPDQLQFACLINNAQTGQVGLGIGATQQAAINVAQSSCGSGCDNLQCIRNGCVTGVGATAGNGTQLLYYGVATGVSLDGIDSSVANAVANCTGSVPPTLGCIIAITQCSFP